MYNSSIKAWNVIPQDLKWTLSSENECSICMGTVKKINSYILACGHFFHAKCIKEWMNSDTSCPNCRYLIIDIDVCSSPKINK
ncbi:PREDICTED: RING-H2 finger protein ATL74-like [Ceratosolen solmsi marchali]|uniref:RING-H2 finger protein ATL74-like n=1 Tax=Ceratosolen solmsi marchali TaxID=326594 RepID=A0AAJ7DVW5_9HYME|nr:PREDICTED: RING-H2 finger protein ATL74-like [Ceratosolen solmsi marchali]